MNKLLSISVVVVVGLLVIPSSVHPDQEIAGVPTRDDPRLVRLKTYFERRSCPIEELAPDFLEAADRHGLDWRLLPSISIMESDGGKRFLNNNIFGWDSCRTGFPTIRHGIHHVASRLANSKLYKGKDVDGILGTYNPCATYSVRVKRIMRRLGPAEVPVGPMLD